MAGESNHDYEDLVRAVLQHPIQVLVQCAGGSWQRYRLALMQFEFAACPLWQSKARTAVAIMSGPST
jgi:hypothetical protein